MYRLKMFSQIKGVRNYESSVQLGNVCDLEYELNKVNKYAIKVTFEGEMVGHVSATPDPVNKLLHDFSLSVKVKKYQMKIAKWVQLFFLQCNTCSVENNFLWKL